MKFLDFWVAIDDNVMIMLKKLDLDRYRSVSRHTKRTLVL